MTFVLRACHQRKKSLHTCLFLLYSEWFTALSLRVADSSQAGYLDHLFTAVSMVCVDRTLPVGFVNMLNV